MSVVLDTFDEAARCVCGRCPSKPQDITGFYCARGSSSAAVARRGCLCGECPVQIDHDLYAEYYCEVGVAE